MVQSKEEKTILKMLVGNQSELLTGGPLAVVALEAGLTGAPVRAAGLHHALSSVLAGF